MREDKNQIQTHPPRKWRGKPAYNKAQGTPRGLPPALRGSAHMVFWIGPAVQAPLRGFAAKSHSLSTGLHSTLRAFAPGGRRPPLRSRPRVSALIQKTTSPSANVACNCPHTREESELRKPPPKRRKVRTGKKYPGF